MKQLREAFQWITGFVEKSGFVCGTDSVTIADLAIYAWVSALAALKKHLLDVDEFPAVNEWAKRVRSALRNPDKSSDEGNRVLAKFFEDRAGLKL